MEGLEASLEYTPRCNSSNSDDFDFNKSNCATNQKLRFIATAPTKSTSSSECSSPNNIDGDNNIVGGVSGGRNQSSVNSIRSHARTNMRNKTSVLDNTLNSTSDSSNNNGSNNDSIDLNESLEWTGMETVLTENEENNYDENENINKSITSATKASSTTSSGVKILSLDDAFDKLSDFAVEIFNSPSVRGNGVSNRNEKVSTPKRGGGVRRVLTSGNNTSGTNNHSNTPLEPQSASCHVSNMNSNTTSNNDDLELDAETEMLLPSVAQDQDYIQYGNPNAMDTSADGMVSSMFHPSSSSVGADEKHKKQENGSNKKFIIHPSPVNIDTTGDPASGEENMSWATPTFSNRKPIATPGASPAQSSTNGTPIHGSGATNSNGSFFNRPNAVTLRPNKAVENFFGISRSFSNPTTLGTTSNSTASSSKSNSNNETNTIPKQNIRMETETATSNSEGMSTMARMRHLRNNTNTLSDEYNNNVAELSLSSSNSTQQSPEEFQKEKHRKWRLRQLQAFREEAANMEGGLHHRHNDHNNGTTSNKYTTRGEVAPGDCGGLIDFSSMTKPISEVIFTSPSTILSHLMGKKCGILEDTLSVTDSSDDGYGGYESGLYSSSNSVASDDDEYGEHLADDCGGGMIVGGCVGGGGGGGGGGGALRGRQRRRRERGRARPTSDDETIYTNSDPRTMKKLRERNRSNSRSASLGAGSVRSAKSVRSIRSEKSSSKSVANSHFSDARNKDYDTDNGDDYDCSDDDNSNEHSKNLERLPSPTKNSAPSTPSRKQKEGDPTGGNFIKTFLEEITSKGIQLTWHTIQNSQTFMTRPAFIRAYIYVSDEDDVEEVKNTHLPKSSIGSSLKNKEMTPVTGDSLISSSLSYWQHNKHFRSEPSLTWEVIREPSSPRSQSHSRSRRHHNHDEDESSVVTTISDSKDQSIVSKHRFCLFDIASVQKANSMNLHSYPFAIPSNSIFITLNDGAVILFEAKNEMEAKKVVHGLRWVVARLSFNLIIGNRDVCAELLTTRQQQTRKKMGLLASPGGRPDMAVTSEMMGHVTNHLVEKSVEKLAIYKARKEKDQRQNKQGGGT